jgi:hypothetical protein
MVLDALFAQCAWYRRWSGGIWYLIRVKMYPSGSFWHRSPVCDEVWEEVISQEGEEHAKVASSGN